MSNRPQKRSLTIAGHRTSISLETAFWDALSDTAENKGLSVSQLVQSIDKNREDGGLSSAIRVYLLHHYQGTVTNLTKNEQPANSRMDQTD